MVTVIFFGFWRKAFGTRSLGQIQGAAQMITVLASACGPLLLALSKESTGSYLPMFRLAALASVLFGVAAWVVPWPRRAEIPTPLEDDADDLSDRHGAAAEVRA
jgi:hypothetical protein